MNTELQLDSSTNTVPSYAASLVDGASDNQIKVNTRTPAYARMKEQENGIVQSLVRELFEYREGDDPSLPLVWRERSKGRAPKHRDELKVHHGEYRRIKIAGKIYKVHRLVWIYHHGEVPEGMELDHINRDGWDNRISNLRVVPRSLNHRNKVLTKYAGKEQASQFIGVVWNKPSRKWKVQIKDYSGRQHHIGYFTDERKAAAAYDWVVLMVFQAAGLPEFSVTNLTQGLLTVDDVLSIRESDLSPAFIRKLEAGEIALPADDMAA